MASNDSNDKKKQFLEALENCAGNITEACKKIGINRVTHYRWLENDPQYKSDYDAFEESLIDNTESQLRKLINGVKVAGPDGEVYVTPPNATAIIFHLKTRGKRRGYVEKQEIDLKQDKPFIIELTDGEADG